MSVKMDEIQSGQDMNQTTAEGENARGDIDKIYEEGNLRSSDDRVLYGSNNESLRSSLRSSDGISTSLISTSNNTDLDSDVDILSDTMNSLGRSSESILNVIDRYDFRHEEQDDLKEPTDSTDSENSVESTDPDLFDELKSHESDSCPDFTKIDHTVVRYNRNFTRSRGTLGQIVRSIQDMKDRSQNPDPNNAYQVNLYPEIILMCDKIVNRYLELISKIPHCDYIVFGSYLNGTNNDGQMKETNIRHEQKAYRYSQMKETLKSVRDRLRHILANAKRCSKDYTRNRENRKIFKRVINFCLQFLSDVESYIATWEYNVKKCREVCQIEMAESNRRNNDDVSGTNLVKIRSGLNSGMERLVI